MHPAAIYAENQRGYYDLCVIFFVAFLLIANIAATKLIQFGPEYSFFGYQVHLIPLIFDGGAITFPLSYVLGDVISEVYGFKAAKRTVICGFVISIMASLLFWIVGKAPGTPDYQNQAAYEAVLGFVPNIVIASMCGYIFGQLLNSYVLVWMKNHWGEKNLWTRLIGSTLVGELADTVIFCFVAFGFVIRSWDDLLNYIVLGYLYKCAVEVFCLPITYRVIAYVKKHDPAYQQAKQLQVKAA